MHESPLLVHVEGCVHVGDLFDLCHRAGGGRTNSPTLALEPKWRTRHSAQGLRYCRAKALPNQPYMTHTNTFHLMKTFGYPTSIGRWGFQDQGGCTPPSLLSRSVRIVPMFVSGYCVHPNVLGPWSIIRKWCRKCVSLSCRPATPIFSRELARVSPALTITGQNCALATLSP